jgi:sporulation protein YlmC with PRC-barrel domain
MSYIKIAGVVSALALMVAVTAYTEADAGSASDVKAQTPIISAETKADLKADWATAKQSLADSADKAGDSTQAALDNFRARYINDESATNDVTINAQTTAKGMLGQSVNDTDGKKIGTLKDIILDKDGKAVIAVVSDGGFIGMGDKLAAFNYNLVMQQNADGDVIMPISKETMKEVAEFSYEAKDASDKVHVVPANGYSTSELLKGQLVDPQSNALGNIENITFRGGEASQVIVAFDEKLGVGGDRAALDFDDLVLSRSANGALDFRMNTRQSAQFNTYKSTKTN